MSSYEMLLSRVRVVRRRWRAQMMLKAASIFIACSIVMLASGVWGADLFGFKPAAVWIIRLAAAGAVVFVAVRFLYLPLRRRVSDIQIAQFVEEHFPQLEDRLVTAVEFGRGAAIPSGMLDLLIRDALEKTSRLDLSVFTGRRKLAAYGSLGLAAFLALFALIAWGPEFFRFGFGRIYMPWTEAAGNSTRVITVIPGDLDIARGADQQIKAQLAGFDGRDVRLFTMPAAATGWTPLAMEPEPRGSGFLYLLVEVQSSLRYYVEAQGVRSPTYTLTVTDNPRVEKITLRYTFPAYTGMPPQTTENDGDISALKGTRVDLGVHLNHGAKGARLLFDDRSTLELVRSGDGDFGGNLTLNRSGSYVVQVDAGGKQVAGSPEYEIEALDDAPPKISISKPQRDLRATNVEEIFTELKAEDDIGTSRVELHYSVNGSKEKTLLVYGGQAQPAVTAAHTFFLEEFGLQPGDIVSYYGKAYDNNNVSGPGTSSSDIYFIQVRPFEQKYTQSQQSGGGAGSGGEEGQEALSRQQKDIISATFKLIRDRDQTDPKDYAANLKALALVQSRLQVQAQGILERFKRRGVAGVNEDFAKLTKYIEAASGEMGKAAVDLGSQKPADALPQEQKALQQLMRAESLFREIQVAFSSQMAGGGSNSQASAEDLADLFELEMNKLKNQYETVQRAEQQARDQKIDEAMERLKELAKRQQQLNERNRSMAMRGGGSSAGSAEAGRSQQQLIDEAEKLQRQLQRLSRERSSPELNRVGSQLEQSIQEMKRALEQNQRKSTQEANARGARALQQLEDARQALARGQQGGLDQGLEQAIGESKQLLDEQNRIRDGVSKLAQDRSQAATPSFQQKRDEMIEKKSLLADRVRNLGKKIDDLSRSARKVQGETGSRLNDASAIIRDKSLPERILSGNQMLATGAFDYLKGREDSVRLGLEDLKKQLESARDSLGQTREGKLSDAVNRTRQLADGLESLRRRMQSRQNGQQSGQSESDGRRQGSQSDRQANGQPGSQANGRSDRQSNSPSGSQSAQQSGQSGQSGQGGGRGGEAANQRGNSGGTAGAPGRNADRLSADAGGPPVGTGGMTGEELRQFRSESQERLAEAQDLRRLVDRNSVQAPNLDRVLESLRGLEASAERQAEMTARLKAAIDMLHLIDRDLSMELNQLNQKEKYLYSEDNEAPGAYRKLVEEYYKALARSRQ